MKLNVDELMEGLGFFPEISESIAGEINKQIIKDVLMMSKLSGIMSINGIKNFIDFLEGELAQSIPEGDKQRAISLMLSINESVIREIYLKHCL